MPRNMPEIQATDSEVPVCRRKRPRNEERQENTYGL